MVKKTILYGIMCVLLIGMLGCNVNNDKEKKASESTSVVKLTQRQKSILKDEGLATNYEELTYSQKQGIMAIEDMLIYLENKYDKEFKYLKYISPDNMENEKERLRACAVGGDPKVDSFDVCRTENGFEDNYMLVALRDDYTDYIKGLIVKELNYDKLKVFSDIYTTELEEIPQDKDSYKSNVSSWKGVYIYVSDISDDEIMRHCKIIENMLKRENIRYDCDVVFLKKDVLDKISVSNYSDYFQPDYCIERYTIKVD